MHILDESNVSEIVDRHSARRNTKFPTLLMGPDSSCTARERGERLTRLEGKKLKWMISHHAKCRGWMSQNKKFDTV